MEIRIGYAIYELNESLVAPIPREGSDAEKRMGSESPHRNGAVCIEKLSFGESRPLGNREGGAESSEIRVRRPARDPLLLQEYDCGGCTAAAAVYFIRFPSG